MKTGPAQLDTQGHAPELSERFLVRITGQSHFSLPLVFEQVRFQRMGMAPNYLAIMRFEGVLQ